MKKDFETSGFEVISKGDVQSEFSLISTPGQQPNFGLSAESYEHLS